MAPSFLASLGAVGYVGFALGQTKAILSSIEKAARFPEHFPPDKYRLNNSGSFRAFEIYSFRVSFYYNPEIIRIVRIRHTKQRPLNY